MAAMKQSKVSYAELMANPCLFQLMAEQVRLYPPRSSGTGSGIPVRDSNVVTNLGRIEDELAVLWTDADASNRSPIFRVDKLHFGHR